MSSTLPRPELLVGILWEFLIRSVVNLQRGLKTNNGKLLPWPDVSEFGAIDCPLYPVGLGLKWSHPVWVCVGRADNASLWVKQTSLSLITQYICLYGRLSINPGTQILMSEPLIFPFTNTVKWGRLSFELSCLVLRPEAQLHLHVRIWFCAYLWSLSRI